MVSSSAIGVTLWINRPRKGTTSLSGSVGGDLRKKLIPVSLSILQILNLKVDFFYLNTCKTRKML